MSETIYISKRCEHCHELLLLLHKYKHILHFKIVDVDTNSYPNIITTVPSMVIDNKILPGIELFKFIEYLINENTVVDKSENNQSDDKNDNQHGDQPNNMNNQIDVNTNNQEKNDNNQLDGFCFGNSDCLLFSSFDDESHSMCNYEKLQCNEETKTCTLMKPENTARDKTKEFDDDLSRLSQERSNDYMR